MVVIPVLPEQVIAMPANVIGSPSEPNWTEIYKINSTLYKGWESATPLLSTMHKQIEAFCCAASHARQSWASGLKSAHALMSG